MGLQLLQGELNKAFESTTACTSSSHQENSPCGTSATLQELKGRFNEIADLEKDISSNAHVAVEILNELLSYDKVETGSMRLELTVIPIFELIQQTVSEFRQAAKLKSIAFTLDFGLPSSEDDPERRPASTASLSDLPKNVKIRQAVGDVSRLSQVIRNLLSNSIKFTPDGGKLSIRAVRSNPEIKGKNCVLNLHSGVTETFVRNGTLQLEVTDTGAGMTPAQLKSIFREGIQFDVNLVSATMRRTQSLLWLRLVSLTNNSLPCTSASRRQRKRFGTIYCQRDSFGARRLPDSRIGRKGSWH